MRHTLRILPALILLTSICFPLCTFAAGSNSSTSSKAAKEDITPQKNANSAEINSKVMESPSTKKHARRHGKGSASAYAKWKMKLPFWPRKAVILTELMLYILVGVFLGQALEVMGVVRWLAVLTYPFLWLGRLPSATGPAFIMSLQSGAIANSMLVAERDTSNISSRQLYASVLVVSCLSLFAHLPTYIMPLGMALGWTAATAFFAVRFSAILVEIICILLVCRLLNKPQNDRETESCSDKNIAAPKQDIKETKWHEHFFSKVWKRSHRTAKRLMIYVIPSFCLMATLEYYGFFKWLEKVLPGLFSLGFLPPQATAIIPAQAASLFNGVAIAGNFVNDGTISSLQAAAILLVGSLVTAPVRTLKHALPTYLSILGPRAGTALAITAQVLRTLFTAAATALLFAYISAAG